jgi:hypothetical protein
MKEQQAEEKTVCRHPERLEGKPEECSEAQIQECHGEVEKHPCEEETRSSVPDCWR